MHGNTYRQGFRKGILGSLVVHAVVLLCLSVFKPAPFPASTNAETKIDLEIVEKLPANATEKKQIVDQDDKAINDELDEKAKFLSKNNQKVLKQSIAKDRGEFKNIKSQGHRGLSFQDVTPQMNLKQMVDKRLEAERKQEKDLESLALNSPTKQPKVASTAGAQSSASLDYIPELDPGLETMLSTREFVYYSFYARIREQLAQHWTSMVREKLSNMYRQGRQIASSDDRVTKLLITLDKQGKIVKIQVIGDSGVRDLDEAAVEAFRAAAPFPNPPQGIVESDGTIKIRWDFILEA